MLPVEAALGALSLLALDENLDLPRPFGPYTLLRRLAVGGMAEVYVGKTKGIGGFEKLVAIKVIHPRYSEDAHFVKMLVEEAKISVLLTHVNIAQTFDLGEVEDTYYIAMELVEGADAYRVMRKCAEAKKALPIDVCAFVVSEMCNGLDYAHRKRDPQTQQPLHIVHRDISPQNVLISYAGEVKIVDFGIAKAASRSEHTEAGVIKGKYYYMSPEQAWGDPMDHRSDVFSTGVVLYELLTGRMLYNDDNIPLLLDKVRKAEIQPPEKRRPSIPKSLSDVVMRSLARDPADRYQSAAEMGHALTQWLYANSPTFSATRLGDLMIALFPPETARTSGITDLSSSGVALPAVQMPSQPPPAAQLASKPPMQLASLADLAEDGDDATRNDVLPYRKLRELAQAKEKAAPAPAQAQAQAPAPAPIAAAAPVPSPAAQRATLRPAKRDAQVDQPQVRSDGAWVSPVASARSVDVVTTNPRHAPHDPTDQTNAANDEWDDPTNLARKRPKLDEGGDADDFEDSTLVDQKGLYAQVQKAIAGREVVQSDRGRVNAGWAQPKAAGAAPQPMPAQPMPAQPAAAPMQARPAPVQMQAPAPARGRGSVPPPPSRQAFTGRSSQKIPAMGNAPPPRPSEPQAQVLETFQSPDAPEPPTTPLDSRTPGRPQRSPALEDQGTIPLSASQAAPVAQAIAQQFGPPPSGWQQGPWPSVPAQPPPQAPRPSMDPFGGYAQPQPFGAPPPGADPFAAPPPVAPVAPADLGKPSPMRWLLAGIGALLLAAIVGAIVYLVAGSSPPPEITIISAPPGATVTFDGRDVGAAPVTIREGLEVGRAYEVRVAHEGYRPLPITVQVQPGAMQQSVILQPLPAALHVESNPPGAQITVGGAPRGAAPVDVAGFMVGQTVEVRASMPGHGAPVIQTISMDREQTTVTLTIP